MVLHPDPWVTVATVIWVPALCMRSFASLSHLLWAECAHRGLVLRAPAGPAEGGGFTGRCGPGSESRGRRVCVAGGIRPDRGWSPRLDRRTRGTRGTRGRRSAGGGAANRRRGVNDRPHLSTDAVGTAVGSLFRTVLTELLGSPGDTDIPLAFLACPSLFPPVPPHCSPVPVAQTVRGTARCLQGPRQFLQV